MPRARSHIAPTPPVLAASQAPAAPTETGKSKAAKPTRPTKAVQSAKPAKTAKAPTAAAVLAAEAAPVTKPARLKQKLVRDGFTMPQNEHALIAQIKERALGFRRPTKKSEVLRAGLLALSALPDDALATLLNGLTSVATGRPKKGH